MVRRGLRAPGCPWRRSAGCVSGSSLCLAVVLVVGDARRGLAGCGVSESGDGDGERGVSAQSRETAQPGEAGEPGGAPGPAGGHPQVVAAAAAGQPCRGSSSSRRRRVAGGADGLAGSAIKCVQRSRLCASAAITVQAALALNLPDGKCARAWSLRSRIASSTTACWRCSASTRRVVRCGWSGTRSGASRATARPVTDQPGAADDQALLADPRLGDLRFAVFGVVGQRLPGGLVDRVDGRPDVALLADPDRVGPARAAPAWRSASCTPRIPSRRAPDFAGRAGAVAPGRPTPRRIASRRATCWPSPCGPDVQRLAGVGTGRQQRVVAALSGVAVGGALFLVRRGPRSRRNQGRSPAALRPARRRPARPAADAFAQHPIKLADVAEGKRAQERAQRRRRQQAVAQHRLGGPGAQHVGHRSSRRPAAWRAAATTPWRPDAPRPAARPAARPHRSAAPVRAAQPTSLPTARRRWPPGPHRRSKAQSGPAGVRLAAYDPSPSG